MNVSMMDSYNLAWKLAYTIHGLSPKSLNASVLATYGDERLEVAKLLIEFDTKFSSMFSGQIGSDSTVEGLTHEQFLQVFSDGSGFTSGCGIEYPPGTLVQSPISDEVYPITGNNYLQGVLKPGRRLLDSVVRRYADANLRHLQDGTPSSFHFHCMMLMSFTDLLSTGRFRILVFTTLDLLDVHGISSHALADVCYSILPTFPQTTVELVVLHPFLKRRFEWTNIPSCIKETAEMKFHGPAYDDLYSVYGVDPDKGVIVVVRPDGYVGMIGSLFNPLQADTYLRHCLVKVVPCSMSLS